MSQTTSASAVRHFSDDDFQTEVLESPQPVLVDFYADWCGPCKMLAPTLEQIAAERQGQVTVGKVDVDQHVQAALNYRVSGLPTVLVFKAGQLVETLVGVQPKHRYEQALEKAAAIA